MMVMGTSPSGARAFGRYELIIELSKSKLGSLWAAVAPADEADRPRLIRRVSSAAAESFDRLQSVGGVGATAESPHVLGTVDILQEQGELGLTYPYVPGESLRALLRLSSFKHKPVAAPIAFKIAGDILRALNALHATAGSMGHGGLTPDSVWVGTDGHSRLLDSGAYSATAQLDAVGRQAEMIGYAAPEAVDAPNTVDARSDVFSVGVILWELLSGRRLFVGASFDGVADKVRACTVPRLDDSKPAAAAAISPAAADLVARALAKDAAARFATPGEMLAAIDAARLEADASAAAELLEELAGPTLKARQNAMARATQAAGSLQGAVSARSVAIAAAARGSTRPGPGPRAAAVPPPPVAASAATTRSLPPPPPRRSGAPPPPPSLRSGPPAPPSLPRSGTVLGANTTAEEASSPLPPASAEALESSVGIPTSGAGPMDVAAVESAERSAAPADVPPPPAALLAATVDVQAEAAPPAVAAAPIVPASAASGTAVPQASSRLKTQFLGTPVIASADVTAAASGNVVEPALMPGGEGVAVEPSPEHAPATVATSSASGGDVAARGRDSATRAWSAARVQAAPAWQRGKAAVASGLAKAAPHWRGLEQRFGRRNVRIAASIAGALILLLLVAAVTAGDKDAATAAVPQAAPPAAAESVAAAPAPPSAVEEPAAAVVPAEPAPADATPSAESAAVAPVPAVAPRPKRAVSKPAARQRPASKTARVAAPKSTARAAAKTSLSTSAKATTPAKPPTKTAKRKFTPGGI
jgi:serine/threonine-protein kinase